MKKTIKVLNQMVEDGIVSDYAIGGAIALSFYTEPQETADIDIFVHFHHETVTGFINMGPMWDYLTEKHGFSYEGEHINIHGFPVQFLSADELTGEAMKNAESVDVDGEQARVLTKEYLAAIMVNVGRPKDKVRLELLLELGEFDFDKFETILRDFGLLDKWSRIKDKYGYER